MKSNHGFTLVELAVVGSIILTLLGFITINLVNSQQNASLTSQEEILLADLKQQQTKAMIGDTEGRTDSDQYGIHFDLKNYVLFHGSVYLAEDSANSIINLSDNMEFDNPGFDIIFSKTKGETVPKTIILKDVTNSRSKKIHINQYGVVYQIESL